MFDPVFYVSSIVSCPMVSENVGLTQKVGLTWDRLHYNFIYKGLSSKFLCFSQFLVSMIDASKGSNFTEYEF